MSDLIEFNELMDVINPEGSHELTSEEAVLDVVGQMLGMEQADCPVTHHFGPNLYMREVNIAAGVFSIGHYQKTEHLNFLVKGRVLMMLDDGTVNEVSAPYIYTSKPGRKVGLILEDMTWFNIYSTNETNIDVLESTYLDKAKEWGDSDFINKQLEYIVRHKDREDFDAMLLDLDMTKEQLEEKLSGDDLTEFPFGSLSIVVSDSQIEGKGIFATKNIKQGDLVAPVKLGGCRTPAGQYTNHSPNPNAELVLLDNNDIVLAALTDIDGCKGGDLGEEITIDYRRSYGGLSCQQQ